MAISLFDLLQGLGGAQPQGQLQSPPQGQPTPPTSLQAMLQPQSQPPAVLPNAQPTSVPGSAPDPVQPDIAVSNRHIDPMTLHQGLLGGMFAGGHTGGNILGLLGDAFLTQAGKAPQYAPRLQQAREAEALKSFDTDPSGALSNLMQINAPLALNQENVLADNNRQQAASNSVIQDQTLARQLKGRNIVAGMIYASNPGTWPAFKAKIKREAERHGLDPADVPDDMAEAKAWAGGSIPADEQQKIAATAGVTARRLNIAQQNADSNEYYRTHSAANQDKRTQNDTVRTDHTVNPAPTPNAVKGDIAYKMAHGGWNSLTPNEKDTWTRLNPPKKTNSKYSITTDANGNISIGAPKP
jgi:hypothetical protein